MPRYDVVVSDASPLISLEKLPDGFSLLEFTCSRLLVPETVVQEVSYFLEPDQDYFDRHGVRRFVEVEIVPSNNILLRRSKELGQLGPGERYAIELARVRRTPLLVEERRARHLAREDGLQVFGAAAVIKIAREEHGIEAEQATELLHILFRANRINRKILDHVLDALRH